MYVYCIERLQDNKDNKPVSFFPAFLTSCFVLLNTFWGVIWFSAWDDKNWLNIALVVSSHLFVSLMVSKYVNLFFFILFVAYYETSCLVVTFPLSLWSWFSYTPFYPEFVSIWKETSLPRRRS